MSLLTNLTHGYIQRAPHENFLVFSIHSLGSSKQNFLTVVPATMKPLYSNISSLPVCRYAILPISSLNHLLYHCYSSQTSLACSASSSTQHNSSFYLFILFFRTEQFSLVVQFRCFFFLTQSLNNNFISGLTLLKTRFFASRMGITAGIMCFQWHYIQQTDDILTCSFCCDSYHCQ